MTVEKFSKETVLTQILDPQRDFYDQERNNPFQMAYNIKKQLELPSTLE